MITGDRIVIGAAALIAVLLQVLLAPHIVIGYAVPNFLAALCIVLSVTHSGAHGPVLPFVLGLLFDLLSGGPVGTYAFTLTAVSALSGWVFSRANNDTIFMALVIVVAGMFCTELISGLVYLLLGYASGVIEAFVYRILPCFVYDAVIALIMYLILVRISNRDAPVASEIRQLH